MLGVFLALSLNPAALKAAQLELDTVIGPDRMPDFDDEEALVYVRATVMEALRWHTGIPLGLPHATIEDSELRGWFIPKGTVVIPNVGYVHISSTLVSLRYMLNREWVV